MKPSDLPPESRCVACLDPGLFFFGPCGDFRYYRCSQCGTLQLVPMPDPQCLTQAYTNEYAGAGHCQAAPERRNREAAPQFRAIAEVVLAHGKAERILDYGSGWGGLLDELSRRGAQVTGAELSDAMAAYCEGKGHEIVRAELSDHPGAERYDAIVLSSVFEHFPDPAGWLAHARRLLKRDGLLVSLQPTAHFAAWAAQWLRLGVKSWPLPPLHQVFWAPWHTVLFSREGMRLLCERNRFTLLDVRPAPLQRGSGLAGLLQRLLAGINHVATPVCGSRWPLHVGHIFVARRQPDD